MSRYNSDVMKRSLTTISASCLAIACYVFPGIRAQAIETAGSTQTYRTAISDLHGISYPVTGSLQLTDDNGVLRGIYRSDDGGNFVPVYGGVDGSNIWIDFGTAGRVRITGRYDGGMIVGSSTTDGLGAPMKFVARPSAQ